jgi:hypothetical protein
MHTTRLTVVLALLIASLVADETVPLNMINLWRRLTLESPKGKLVDNTTRVFNLQTDSMYVDIRIPISRDNFSDLKKKPSISQYTMEELWEVAKQKTFAGYCRVNKSVANWDRKIDFQPFSGSYDIGTVDFVTNHPLMIEEGIGSDDYRELWEPQTGNHQFVSLILLNETQGTSIIDAKGFMVINPTTFIHSINNREFELSQADSLLELFKREKYTRKKIEAVIGKFVTCYGKVSNWLVKISTFPFLEDKPLQGKFEQKGDVVTEIGPGYVRAWKIMSMTFNPFL